MYQHKRLVFLTSTFVIAILAVAAFLALMGGGQMTPVTTAQAASPRAPTHTIIDSDTTWGPGVITITSDVVIQNGAVLTISPYTKVVFGTEATYTDTTPYPGGVSELIEIIVEDGRLVADGYVTTTQIITPFQTITFTSGTWGDPPWYGIRILDGGVGGESIINFARIDMCERPISIDNAAPIVSHNVMAHVMVPGGSSGSAGANGANGAEGTFTSPAENGGPGDDGGGDGTDGEPAYAIYITGNSDDRVVIWK